MQRVTPWNTLVTRRKHRQETREKDKERKKKRQERGESNRSRKMSDKGKKEGAKEEEKGTKDRCHYPILKPPIPANSSINEKAKVLLQFGRLPWVSL
jgi:hypothetical protein